MIGVITVDVGSTLGPFSPPRTFDVLYELSRIPESPGKSWVVGEAERTFLHTAPRLTDEVIDNVCEALLIDRRHWPVSFPCGRFLPFPYTNTVLAELRTVAPIAALSNISILSSSRMDDLAEHCGAYIGAIYTSYDMQRRKPAPTLWLNIADAYGVPVDSVVHIGDRWVNDVFGAVTAGARAIYLTDTRDHHAPTPEVRAWPASPDRIAVAKDLREVPAVIREWVHT